MQPSATKKIWIDLDNSPHVPFFNPIIKELNNKGYQLIVTARNCFQVCGLAELYNIGYVRIGRHYGKNKSLKVIGTLIRSVQMLPFALREKPVLAVSHGSRSQLLTASMLRTGAVFIDDYEYSRGVPFITPDWLILPEAIPNIMTLPDIKHIVRYPGIKEDVYVPEFKPDPAILKELGIKNEDILVTIRPPATEAHYHNPESEKLFSAVIDCLVTNPDVRMVILPRNEKKQTAWVKNKWSAWCANGKIIIPHHVVNGLNLIWHSDFVVSGGGTMNREAAALGVPVYSIFRGKIGAIDRYLSEIGRLTLLSDNNDIKKKVQIAKRNKPHLPVKEHRPALEKIVGHLMDIIQTL